MDHRSWTVIKFVEDDSVQAVPTIWISSNKCYWPPYPKDRLMQCIKKCEPYKDNWPLYEIKIFRNSSYDDYQTARQKERKAEMESDLNSDTENQKRKRFQRLYSSDEDDGEVRSVLRRPPVMTKELSVPQSTIATRISSNSSSPIIAIDHYQAPCVNQDVYSGNSEHSSIDLTCSINQIDRTKDAVLNTPTCSYNTTPTIKNVELIPDVFGSQTMGSAVTVKKTDDSVLGYLRQIIRKQNILQATVLQLVADLNELKNSTNVAHSTPFNGSSIFVAFDMPLKDEASLLELEQYLENEKQLNAMIEEISKIGGCNVPEFIKRVLPKILSNEVASCYSWFGLKKKKIFGKLLLSQVIIRAGLHIFQTETSKSIEEAIKNWLRRAKERIEKNKTKI